MSFTTSTMPVRAGRCCDALRAGFYSMAPARVPSGADGALDPTQTSRA